MKKLLCALLALLVCLSLTACGPKDPGNNPTINEEFGVEVDETKTGNLVIYSPNSDTQIDTALAAFQAKYPNIVVDLQSMGTGDCLSRIEAEKENPLCDVNWGGINYGFYMAHPDCWEEYVSPNDTLLDEAYRNTTGVVSNTNLSGSACFIVNDDLLPEGVKIESYADLLNPALKGKIAMGDPTASSSAWAELTNMLLVMGGYDSEEAWDYVAKFIENLDGIIISSSSHVYKDVINGEYVVGVSYEDPVIQAVIDNAGTSTHVHAVYPSEGAVWLPAGAAIVKNAPNLENAKLFIDFLLSEECQKVTCTTTVRGTITTIEQQNENMKPFSEIKVAYEDIKLCAEKKTEWCNKWMELLQK